MYIICLFTSTIFTVMVMFILLAIIESKNKQKIFYLNFSNPSFRLFISITIFISLILSIILLVKFKKLTKK